MSVTADSLSRQALILSGSRFLAFALIALHPVVLTRVLSKGDYGTYGQFFLVVISLIPLGEIGIAQGIYYFLPKSGVIKRAIAYQASLLTLLTGFAVCGVLLALSRHLAQMLGNPDIEGLTPFMAFYGFCAIASSPFEALIIAEGRSRLAAAVTLGMQLVQSSALIGGAVAFGTIEGMMLPICAAAVLRLTAQYLYIGRRFGFPPAVADITGIRQTLGFILPMGAASFIWTLQGRIQGYTVSALFSPMLFAVYSVGTVSLPFVGIITATAANVLMPEISKTVADADGRTHILTVWNSAIRKMNLFLLPIFVFFFILAEPFIVLVFTDQYIDSVPLFRLSLLNVLIASINNGVLIGGMGESRYLMRLSILRLPLSLVIIFLLAVQFGVAGAVIGNVVVSVLIILIEFQKVAFLLRVSVIKLIRWNENGRIFVAAVTAALPIAIFNAAGWSPAVTLTAAGAVYALSYLYLARLLALQPSEVEMTKNIVSLAVTWLRARFPGSGGTLNRPGV